MSKMSIKDKDTKTFEKLKQFFRSSKGNYKCNEEHILTQEIEREISSQSPVHHRARAIKDLCDDVLRNNWEDKAAERLWNLVQDLLHKDTPKEHRHTVFYFLCCLIEGQFSRLSSLIRVKFFMIVQNHEIPEDISLRLEMLQRLTCNGKDIRDLEEKMGPFLLEWMPSVTGGDGKRSADFLSLLINVIKYNSAYIDEEIVSGLVRYICHLCRYSNNADVISGCLISLETIVGYHKLQADSLPTFIAALCRSVNVESYCSISWEIMRKLLGTHMGHSALYTMCCFLQDTTFKGDVRLLRGAVFYVNMGLWGTNRIPKLECPPISVLPSFIQALNCNHPIVMFEVTLAMKRLIIKFGTELLEPTWSIVLDIIEKVIVHIETSNQPATKQVIPQLHETLNSVELLLDNFQFNGNAQRFYKLIERRAEARSECSVLKLIDYRASMINPTCHHWQYKLGSLVERYYKIEYRTSLRVKVLDVVNKVIHINRSRYEDELIEKIIVPYLQHVDMDHDITIRNVAANMLVDLCLECETKRCLELLDILEKIINKPFALDITLSADADIKDIKTGVVGLIKILTMKIHRLPSSHAINAYKILAGHLEHHYKEPQIFFEFSTIRYLIFECFLRIRVNSLHQLGFADSDTAIVAYYSPYLLLEHGPTIERLGSGNSSPPPASPAFHQRISFQITTLSLALACKNIISCLKQEKDWKVLQLVLKEMPNVMQNRALILSRHNNDIDYLAAALCSMVTDKSPRIAESFYNVPQKITLSDFLMFVFPVLASLVSYHAHLDPNLQQRLIKCLEVGLTTRCVGQCITSLTTCTLEMRDAMNKLLPDVLLKLSKISATVHIAIPILEFLSTLTRLPKVFSSFITDQYRLIFAILMPYTNPFKYNHYIVSLTHYVIAIWFLKCRLPLRKDFVKFITGGLKGNVLEPLEGLMKDYSNLNEDSSHRKRSSSLTEQGSRVREKREREEKIVRNSIISDKKPPMDENLMNLNIELTETCIDLMAKYTFSSYTAQPKRLPAADFLLKEGQSMTWLLGNRLITITTSGCSTKVMRSGLCDNCWTACKVASTTPEYRPGVGIPRRSSEENRLSRQSSGHTGSSGNTAANSPTEEKKSLDDDGSVKAIERREYEEKESESKLEQILNSEKQEEHLPCACWCQGWAEIYVRRPTGDVSWIMRIQNSGQFDASLDFPLHDITALYMPTSEMPFNRSQDTTTTATTTESFEDEPEEKSESNFQVADVPSNAPKSTVPIAIPAGSPGGKSVSRQSSKDSMESFEDGDDDSQRSRNPVRRSHSSPEMSASWKNPFLNKDKLVIPPESSNSTEYDGKHAKNTYTKDMRVSCEAIPEEISGMGTTPPTEVSDHPNVLKTQYSYPGATQPTGSGSSSSNSSNSNTVPASPTTVQPGYSLARAVPHHLPLSKPPQSPTQPYSRTSTSDSSLKQTSNIENKPPSGRFYQNERRDERPDPSALPPFSFRDRGHTISVMSPVKPPRASPRVKETPKTGINPSFVFLQLYHTSFFGSSNEKPLLVSPTPALQRAVTNLDRIQPYETHKIGVLYIGNRQASNEAEILANQHGSLRYAEFLQRLGTLVRLKDVDESVFLGGLDRNGEHGNFTYIWQDDVTQVVFHVATLMPTQQSDPKCTRKKQHIGNDYVTIVYNESGDSYDIQTVKGQFNYACVVIQPLDHGTNQMTVQAREEVAEHIGHSEPKIISDQNLGILARQLALHANLASMVSSSLKQKGHSPYASNWLERLRNIKRLRRRLQESSNSNSDGQSDEQRSKERVRMDDFTEYTT